MTCSSNRGADYRDVLFAEGTAVQLEEKFGASIRTSIRREREVVQLASRSGNRLTSALVRVAVRRLLDNRGNLTADLTTVAPVHNLRPETPKARIAVALDDEAPRASRRPRRPARLHPAGTVDLPPRGSFATTPTSKP